MEETFITSTYTTAVVYAALQAAADLAEKRDDADSVVAWRAAADDIRSAAVKHLYNADAGVFRKGLVVNEADEVVYNETIDLSSFFGSFMFGLFAVDSDEVSQSAKNNPARLWSRSSPSGVILDIKTITIVVPMRRHQEIFGSLPHCGWPNITSRQVCPTKR